MFQGKNDLQWNSRFPKYCCCDSRPCYGRPTMPSGFVMHAWGDVDSASSSFLCAFAILSFFLSSIFWGARSFFFKSFMPSWAASRNRDSDKTSLYLCTLQVVRHRHLQSFRRAAGIVQPYRIFIALIGVTVAGRIWSIKTLAGSDMSISSSLRVVGTQPGMWKQTFWVAILSC